ncbi:MAG: hypothetical protein HEQ13_15770 [Dolichospermum sp. DEX189]|jgi:hypothetical protein|nr:hypothetical protein [Dolichospermum sp. DEX189]
MSNVMQYTETSEVLGIPITLKMLMQSENEFTIIAIKDDGEFHKLFTYMADIDALEADKAEVSKLADDYARQVNKTLKGVIVVSDGVVWFVTNVMDFISSMFGGLAGFGLIGIAFVLGIILTIATLWIYAFFIIGPLMAISFILKAWLNNKKEKAIKQLSRNSLEFARRCKVDLDL